MTDFAFHLISLRLCLRNRLQDSRGERERERETEIKNESRKEEEEKKAGPTASPRYIHKCGFIELLI